MPPRLRPGSVCSRCHFHRRSLSSTAFLAQKQAERPPPPPEAGHVRLVNRALISLTGADSTSFLQGLITQNVVSAKSRASPTTPFYAGFLNAQGRLLHDTFIYPTLPEENGGNEGMELGYLIEVDKEQVTNLLKHLKKHKLRAKLKFRALDEGERGPETICRTCRSRFLDNKRRSLPITLRRILHGIPEGQDELGRESALPMDSNMDIMGGIDFHKGCYLGQELTIRTHHRGVVRKRVLPVQLYNTEDPKPMPSSSGIPVYSPDSQLLLPSAGANITKSSASGKGRSAGKFISRIGNVGLALCRLETMTDISLTGESSQYNPSEEFKISWEANADAGVAEAGEVKVTAFIPPWVKDYILHGGTRQRQTKEDVHRAKSGTEQIEEED
ncbi:glycine cleavage T-protein [Coccidioides immitis RMSCC 3703]|uniref:Iron-sulfur cluster assembly factor IBA57 homolog, mitochondrial n=1 Tax=Coccidioides immitis RMSCC 3703 TaxID=454286 RepID=A0A0J8QNS3_COCIT|nr:glycine cleavage T-protein [Coccidioides immitis RMSCC 3703]